MNSLTSSSFKHSINCYWVTSREAPDSLWLEEWSASETIVEKFNLRANEQHPHADFTTHQDTFQHFIRAWESKVCAHAARSHVCA